VLRREMAAAGEQWQRSNNDSTIQFDYETVDETYLSTLKIPLVQGKKFFSRFSSDSANSVLVNESFVKQAGWKNPMGQTVNFWYNNKKYTVIGVVKDYHYQPLNQKIESAIIYNETGQQLWNGLYKNKSRTPLRLSLQTIQKKFKQLFPIKPL
jgi:putative ABC transport system permease protein